MRLTIPKIFRDYCSSASNNLYIFLRNDRNIVITINNSNNDKNSKNSIEYRVWIADSYAFMRNLSIQ